MYVCMYIYVYYIAIHYSICNCIKHILGRSLQLLSTLERIQGRSLQLLLSTPEVYSFFFPLQMKEKYNRRGAG